jgi:peptide/nickel transport system substrate-binding protein
MCFGLFAAACSSDSKTTTGSSASTGTSSSQEVPKGGTLIIGAEQEPDCLDWVGSCSGASWGNWTVQVNTMPRTFDIVKKDDGNYEYKRSILLKEDPKLETTPVQKITYTIADDAVWSDGTPITSTDFKYTWDQVANGTDVYDKTGYDQIEGVDDSNPKVAVVTFKTGKSFADWKSLFQSNYGVLPSHLLQGKDRAAEMKDGYKWSGGPWMLESWTKTDSIVLIPNPKYWGTKPSLDKVIFKIQADTSAEFTAFKSGQVSMIYPQPQLDAVDQINAGLPDTQKDIPKITPAFESLWLNNAAAPLDDVNVRKAVAFALDRDAIVKRLFGGIGLDKSIQALAPNLQPNADQNAFASYKQDLAQVDKLLTGAGYAKGADGIYAKGGTPLSFTVRTTAGNKRRELTEQILQDQLKTAGIDMKIDNQKAGDLFGQTLPTGDFQAAIYAQNVTSLGDITCNLFCSKNQKPIGEKGGNNYTRTNIPELDTQLLASEIELDNTKLKDELVKAGKIMADQMVSLPIDPLPNLLLWSNKVVGPIDGNGVLGPFWQMNLWGLS